MRPGAPAYEVRMAASFTARIEAKRKAGAPFPEREAMKGASFTSRPVRDKAERQLLERINRLRPPRRQRPVEQKMSSKVSSDVTLDKLLQESKLHLMPTQATEADSRGLAACILDSSFDNEIVHVTLEGAERLIVSREGSENDKMQMQFCSVKPLLMERYMRDAVGDKSVTVTDMLAELRVSLMDRMRYELARFHGIDFRSEILIRR